MVQAVRTGQSLRSVARAFGVSPATVQLWVGRAGDKPLDQVNWEDGSHTPPKHPGQTPETTRARVLELRQQLKQSILGEHGAHAIRAALLQEELPAVPSVATINRLLRHAGAFDARKRKRRPAPPRGWYLPEVAGARAEIDETDYVEGLYLEGDSQEYFVLNTFALHGGLCGSWLTLHANTDFVLACLQSHWQAWGRPDYAQFDNGNVFTGPRHYPDTIGRVIRLCLRLAITPVFAVPAEFGIQSAIESYNNRWQQKVWQRTSFANLVEAQQASARYVAAVRHKHRQRQEQSPPRRPFPKEGTAVSSLVERQGQILFLRRTNGEGEVEVLGHTYPVQAHWCHRLVRCEVHLATDTIQVYGLRRSEPDKQPLLREWKYRLPDKILHAT